MILKQADQLVREGKYEDALKVISRARASDPGNLYALAYEERVLALLNDHRRQVLNPGEARHDHLFPPADEQVVHRADTRDRSEPQSHLPGEMQARVAMMVSRAHELRNRGEFDRALDEVSRAFLIDSSSPELIRLEHQLWKERNISVMRLKAKQPDERPTPTNRKISVSCSDHEPESIPGTPEENETEQQWQGRENRQDIMQLQQVPDSPAKEELPNTGHAFDSAGGNRTTQRGGEDFRDEMLTGASADLPDILARAEFARQHRNYSAALDLLTEAYAIVPESRQIRKLEMAIRREELLQNESG
jgi:tetratricopeptide (TPR) repeat protein